ncbi:cell surface protein, partial [Brachyspira hampsonii]|nr:cell surface protein [Brachyspira hampsonii]
IYFKYGQSGYKNVANNSDMFAQSVGFQARFYFLNTPIGNVTINPYVKVEYNTALIGNNTMVRAGDSLMNTLYTPKDTKWDKNPYD